MYRGKGNLFKGCFFRKFYISNPTHSSSSGKDISIVKSTRSLPKPLAVFQNLKENGKSSLIKSLFPEICQMICMSPSLTPFQYLPQITILKACELENGEEVVIIICIQFTIQLSEFFHECTV